MLDASRSALQPRPPQMSYPRPEDYDAEEPEAAELEIHLDWLRRRPVLDPLLDDLLCVTRDVPDFSELLHHLEFRLQIDD